MTFHVLSTLILAFEDAVPAGKAAQQPSPLITLMPLAFMFGVFYLLILRPQQKERKRHGDWLSTIQKNDKVVTAGGLIGTVADASNDEEITLKLDDSTRVKVLRKSISGLYGKDAADKT